MVLSIFLIGCGESKGAVSQVENQTESTFESEKQIPDTYISGTTECSREENPELYDAMENLLEDRAKIQFLLASPGIDLNSKDTIETADGMLYYLLKDETLSKEELRNRLLEVYESNYVDRVLFPHYFDIAKYYMERDDRLYGQDTAAVITTLKEDWAYGNVI